MKDNSPSQTDVILETQTVPPAAVRPLLRPIFIVSALGLILCFGLPLYRLVHFALHSDLYSYVLLVPFVTVYLFRSASRPIPGFSGTNRITAAILLGLGILVLGVFLGATLSGVSLILQDSLSVTTVSFVLLMSGVCALFLDRASFRRAAFPLAFLLFIVPFPLALEQAIEAFLQRGSAPPAFWFLKLAGTPVFREDMIFQLPGITLHIAPECSGIRSSIVLFMTSLVAGHLFLRSPWKRAILSFAVIPLALLRNGFRVFVIGQLCVNVGPHMIDSALHRYGGTIFFLLSLIPFSLLTFYLLKSDRSQNGSQAQPLSS
jgi:exosortase C (VPDSG-CTERM-specific)